MPYTILKNGHRLIYYYPARTRVEDLFIFGDAEQIPAHLSDTDPGRYGPLLSDFPYCIIALMAGC